MIWAFALGLVVFSQVSTEPAESKKEPSWELSTPAEELKLLQGCWIVRDSQHSSGVTLLLPCLACLGQVSPDAPDASAVSPAGSWEITANGHGGELVLSVDAEGKLTGEMFGDPIRGSYHGKTNQIVIERLRTAEKPRAVQVFTGGLERVANLQPTQFALSGQFESIGGPEWGKADTKYSWTARRAEASAVPSDPNKQPSEGTSPAEELKLLQGEWEVYEAQQSSGSTSPVMPKETGLTEKGTRLVIRGNELLRDGKVIATLANDLTELAPELLTDVKPFRRPLLITLPSGKAVLCAYDKRHLDVLDIATPTTGNVGFGYRIYIGRPKR